jgi:ABC-2 type transport system permease protein
MTTGLKAVLYREIKRMRSETIYLWMLLILPLFTFFLFPTMFSEGKADNYSVAIYDADNSPLSRKIISWIEATPEVNFTKKVYSLQEGKRLIEKGEVYAVLKLPKGLENGVYSGVPEKIVLFYSNINLSAGSGVSTAILKTVKTMSAGINMQKRMSKNKEMFNQALQNVQPIRIDSHALYNPYINYSYYLVTGLLPVMLLMFILSITIYVIGSELKNSTALNWYNLSSRSMVVALTGKLLPYTIVFMIEAYLMNGILLNAIGVPQNGNAFVLLLATTLFVLSYQAMGVMLITIFPNIRLALSMGAMYASLAFSFAGLTYPLIAMNSTMQKFAQIFPFTHYLNIYINEEIKGLDVSYSLHSFIILFVFIILPIIFTPRLKALLTKEKHWGHS